MTRESPAWFPRLTAIAFPWCMREWVGSCETSAHGPPPGQMAESWLLVPSRARFFLYRLGRSLDLSWAGEEASEWITEHTLLSLPFFIDREVEGGPVAPQQLHLIRPCSWRRGLSSGLSGPPVQGFLPDFFHLFQENTGGILKGFDSKLRKQKIHWVTDTLPRIQINLWVWIPGWNPSWCSATTKVADCCVSWRAITTIEGKRERLCKSRTRVYRGSRDAPSIPALTQ